MPDAYVKGGHYFDKTDSIITNAAQAASAPTKAEFDALVGKFNALLAQLKQNDVILK